jgi:regulator of sirC expression with transglutaminase-like and TPR domain
LCSCKPGSSSIAHAFAANEEGGDESIDVLLRVASIEYLPKGVVQIVQAMLERVMEHWAERQWKMLLDDSLRSDLLEEGAFVVSQWADPADANVREMRMLLEKIATDVAARIPSGATLIERVQLVSSVLFEEYGFHGNSNDYYDPKNSFLHCVLARRHGIPISLSILWAAVARRAHIPCFLCAQMPGHIVIRVSVAGQALSYKNDYYVDAFNKKVMDYNELASFVLQMTHEHCREEWVAHCPATAVYSRVLRNLMNIYRHSSMSKLSGVLSQIIAVSPSDAAHFRTTRDLVRTHALDQYFLR